LRTVLPQNLEGLFTYRTRVEFLKQSSFLELSQEAMQFLGLTDQENGERGLIALLPEQTDGVMKFNRVAVLGLHRRNYTM
jgi:hypothetical protein